MTTPTITESAGGFKLSKLPTAIYSSAAEAKADCWQRYGEIAIRMYDDEALFDAQNPLHATLARIESRHSNVNIVVAVGEQWYLIRRSKFGVEVRVNYRRDGNTLHARSDSEPIENAKSGVDT